MLVLVLGFLTFLGLDQALLGLRRVFRVQVKFDQVLGPAPEEVQTLGSAPSTVEVLGFVCSVKVYFLSFSILGYHQSNLQVKSGFLFIVLRKPNYLSSLIMIILIINLDFSHSFTLLLVSFQQL